MPAAASFHSLRDRILKNNDALFAEPVLIAFMTGPGGAPDAARGTVEVSAPLRTAAGEAGAAAHSRNVPVGAQKARLSLDPAAWSGPPVRVGDKVRALARPGQPWFEVLGVDDRNHTRLVLELGEA